MDEHVVREAVPGVKAIEVEPAQRVERQRRVPSLGVGDVPVAGRDLRQQREHRVPEVARPWDHLPRLAGDEPVRLRVLDLAARDRACEAFELGPVHLVVGGHDAGDVDLLLERAPVAGRDRGADSAVRLVTEDLDARVASREGPLAGRVTRRVVDDVDPIDEIGNAAERVHDEALLVVGGHDDRDPLALEHQAGAETAVRRRRAAKGSAASAAIVPMSRPASAPTMSDERRERAVVFTADAGSTMRLISTFSAWMRSWRESKSCSWSDARRASAVVMTELRLTLRSSFSVSGMDWSALSASCWRVAVAIRSSTCWSCASLTSTCRLSCSTF